MASGITTFTLIHVLLSLVGVFAGLVVLPVVVARYVKHLEGGWRGIYVVGAMLALYLNAFVVPAQLFLRLPA